MKKILLIFVILISKFCFGDDICLKFKDKPAMFEVQLSKEGEYLSRGFVSSDSDRKDYDVILTSYGSVAKDDFKVLFNIGSKFELNHELYSVKSCTRGILKVIKMDNIYYFHVSKVTKEYISDPIHQLNPFYKLCNKLLSKGEYTLTLEDDFNNIFVTKFYVNSIKKINYYFEDLNTLVRYGDSYIVDEARHRTFVEGCRTYLDFSSRIQLSDSNSYKLIKVEAKEDINTYMYSLCGVLSVKGLYLLKKRNNPIGELNLTVEPYQSTYFGFQQLNNPYYKYKFRVQFSAFPNYPQFESIEGKTYGVESCFEEFNGNYGLRTDRKSSREPITFDSLDVVNQDTVYLINRKKILEENLEKKFKLSEPISDDEIKGLFLSLDIPVDSEDSQFCKKLFYPGVHRVVGENGDIFQVNNISPIKVYTEYEPNDQKTYHYYFQGSIRSYQNEYHINNFACVDQKSASILLNNGNGNRISDRITIIKKIETTSKPGWNWKPKDEQIFKVKLRSHNICYDLKANSQYSLGTSQNDLLISVGAIKGREFSFTLGYTLFFSKEDKFESTKIIYSHELREIAGKELAVCHSDENGSSLYDLDYRVELKKGVSLDKSEYKGTNAFKFFSVTPL